jgi:uncharacterized membrane protein
MSEERKIEKKNRSIRPILFLIFMGLVILLGVYEKNAHEILNYADSVNEEGLYMTSTMAYEKILEDYPLSLATVRANQQLESPNKEYLFPLRTAQICTLVLFFLIGIKMNRRISVVGTTLLLMISGAFLIIQLVAYGQLDIEPFEEIADELMKGPQLAYFISYALILLTGISMLSNPNPKPVPKNVERNVQSGHRKGTSAGTFIGTFLLIILLIILAAIGLFVYITLSTGGMWLL